MKLYQQCIPDHAEVKINERWIKIDTGGVLVGDIVRVVAGCYVPADLRIIEVESLDSPRPPPGHSASHFTSSLVAQ
jgi:magnesium-transporting ATPase (P-type)